MTVLLRTFALALVLPALGMTATGYAQGMSDAHVWCERNSACHQPCLAEYDNAFYNAAAKDGCNKELSNCQPSQSAQAKWAEIGLNAYDSCAQPVFTCQKYQACVDQCRVQSNACYSRLPEGENGICTEEEDACTGKSGCASVFKDEPNTSAGTLAMRNGCS